jgi:small conductance mechanosensitive channel
MLIGERKAVMDIQQIFQGWLTSFLENLPKIISAIVIFIVTLLGSGYIAKWVKRVSKKKIGREETLQLISRIVRWTVLVFGTVIALNQVSFDITGFIAGIGVAGFTIGFALQDIAKNFVSGLILLYRQPFNLGDLVKVSDYQGKVNEINVRDTVIETLDGELVIIPNWDVFENPIINYTNTRLRRRSIMIGLGYEEDADRAMEIFLDAIKAVPGVVSEPAPTIRAAELGESALTLSALFWIDQQDSDLLGVHSDVVKAIKKASEEHGINLPYPVQKILLRNV